MGNLVIRGCCSIKNNRVVLDGECVYQEDNALSASDFFKNVYRNFKLSYAKFFKMDNLSRLGFLAADILINKYDEIKFLKPEDTGIVLSNSASSLDTDFNFNDTIKENANYFPSPALFVYTLPNIMIGEICIRHKIMGENGFLICEKFNPDVICNFVKDLFENEKLKYCITGWVDLINEKYETLLFLVEDTEKDIAEKSTFEPKNISDIYNKY